MQTPVKHLHDNNFNGLRSGLAEPHREYFNMSPQQKLGLNNKAVAYNNRYYTSAAERTPPIMANLHHQPHNQQQQHSLNHPYAQPSFS